MGKLVLIEIPKTGTTTLTARLKKIYGEKHIWKDKQEEFYHKQIFWGQRDSFPEPTFKYKRKFVDKSFFANNLKCIVGSFPLSKYLYLKSEGWTIATWIRDPLSRRMSCFNRNWNNKGQRKFYNYPNEIFTEKDIVRYVKKQKNIYKAYYDVGIDELDFVGFTETLDESFAKLLEMLGINQDFPKNKRNVAPKYTITMTEEEERIIRDFLDEEYQLYNEIVRKYGS